MSRPILVRVAIAGLVFGLMAIGAAFALAAEPIQTRIILFIWDGTQRQHLLDLYDSGRLPRLRGLVQSGGLLRTDVAIHTDTCLPGSGDGYDTETGPANSAVATGYGYPDTANQDNLAPNPIPAGYTFFERVKAAHPEVRTGMVTSKDWAFWPATPLTNARSTIDYWFQGRSNNALVATHAITFLQTHSASPFFLWVHYRQPDEVGHMFGENSAEYISQTIEADTQTGRVLDKLASLGIDDDTIVLVTTDHGFSEGGSGASAHEACTDETKGIWLAANRAHVIGSAGAPAYQTSIAPTLFDIFGMAKSVTPAFPSQSLWTPPEPVDTPTPTSTPSATPTRTATLTPTTTPSPTSTRTPSLTPSPTGTPSAGAPQTGTFAPNGGSGYLNQAVTFTTTYTDPNGWQDIRYASLILNTTRRNSQGLFVRYDRSLNLIYLRNDAGNGWGGSCAPGSGATLSNSYARLDCAASSAAGSADTLTMNWRVTPLAPFAGAYGSYRAYLIVTDNGGLQDGWDQAGTWTLLQ